jgi:hypothetical protein
MKLIIKRITSILYQTDSLLELELDPLSLSGIDYWSQEARSAKIKLLMDDSLQSILVGSVREIKAGFHTIAAFIYDDANTLIYTGVLPESGFSIEYLSLSAKTVELELVDYMGLVLQLASDRNISLTNQYINPVATIPSIIGSIIHPHSFEPDTESYTNADVLRLILCVGPINYQYAHYPYDQTKGPHIILMDHMLLDSNAIKYQIGTGVLTDTIRFGFSLDGIDVHLIFWQFRSRTSSHGNFQHFRYRKYLVTLGSISLLEEIDQHNEDYYTHWDTPTPPDLLSQVSGAAEYHISGSIAFYSGHSSLEGIEIVPGDYNAKDLLGELLRISNAALTVDNYSFYIKNRQDDELPVAHFSDPIQFDLDQADISKPHLTPVAIASQAIIEAISEHFKKVLEEYPFEARLNTHLFSDDYVSLSLSHPYQLLYHTIIFDHYRIRPLELSYDPISHEIEISGRANHE